MASFSDNLKEELLLAPIGSVEEAQSELCGIIKRSGELSISAKREKIIINTEYANLYKRVDKLLGYLYGVGCKAELSDEQAYSRERYEITIGYPYSRELLEDLEIISRDENGFINITKGINSYLVNTTENAASFLRGVVLSGFTANIKIASKQENNISGYQIEFNLMDEQFARDFCALLAQFDIFPKMVNKKNLFVVYIKDFNQICLLLEVLQAKNSYLALQNENTVRAFKNQVNRQNNCEVANISKTVNASVKQIEAIEKLIKNLGEKNLPQDIKEVCEFRLKNPEDSLENLSKKMGITKSSLNRRLNKIINLSNKL